MARNLLKRFVVFVTLVVMFVTVMVVIAANAHEAPSGWSYPMECCGGMDCGPVVGYSYTNPTDGSLAQLIVTTKVGTVAVPKDFNNYRVSPDNQMHACMRGAMPSLGTFPAQPAFLLCLFIPPSN